MTLNNRTKLGIALAAVVLAVLVSIWLSVLLLVLAGFFIAWGQVPERTEEIVGNLPYGNHLLRGLARVDAVLWPGQLSQTGWAPEEQEDFGQGELVKEEYFRVILRGYTPLARRGLRQLKSTGDPKSVLDEEWVQYFHDGLVETTFAGRGGIRPELQEMIGRLLDEFSDGPEALP